MLAAIKCGHKKLCGGNFFRTLNTGSNPQTMAIPATIT
jgi:hypothetical protein